MKPLRNRSGNLAWMLATATFLFAAVGLHAPASASEESDQANFVEFFAGGATLDSGELDQLRGEGLDIAPASSGDAEIGVAVQLWDDWRQGRQTRNATLGSATYAGEAAVTVNGVAY